jgi:hypothetical protein
MTDEVSGVGALPVYSVTRRASAQAAHPDHRGEVRARSDEEQLTRVGSARLDNEGRYLIFLSAVPFDGQLLLDPRSLLDRTPERGPGQDG